MASIVSRCFAQAVRTASRQGRHVQQYTSKCGTHSTSMSSPKGRLGIGVIGMGRIGEIHLRNILANRRLQLNWIVEENADRAKQVTETYGLEGIPFFLEKDIDRLLGDKDLQGVVILTPTPTHTSLSCKALDKGKAVFVEKPAGESVEDIARCYDAAERNDKPFLVAFNRRFDSTFAKLHEEVIKGSVGKLQYIHLTSRDSPKPSYDFIENCDTTGCSIITDMAVHEVDHLVWITQAERPEFIYVTTHGHDKKLAEVGESDAIGIMIKYKTGAIAVINSFRESVYGYDIRSEVFGSEGMVSAGNPRYASTVLDQAHGGAVTRLFHSFPQRFKAAFEAELDHFCDCMEGKTTPLVTKEEGLMRAEIVVKGVESFHSKQPVYFTS